MKSLNHLVYKMGYGIASSF